MVDTLLSLKGVRKQYGEVVVTEVLRGIDLTISKGEFTAIMGASGSGKSTLLNQIGLLDRPSSGTIELLGQRIEHLPNDERTRLRNQSIGFVFQFHHLIQAFSILTNVMMPLSIRSGGFREEHQKLALSILDRIGLSHRASDPPNQLSGGQMQRVAIARALVHRPELVLADEPTGNLDSKTADSVFSLLRKFNEEESTSFLIVTHDPRMAERCDRVIRIRDGLISDDGDPSRVLWKGDKSGSAPRRS